jgi:glucosamine-phosphate N-acetyltransferase
VSFEEWTKFFNGMDMKHNQTFVLVTTQKENEKVIGTGKILIEPKFHQNFANMAHIEDVVIDSQFRKQNLGLQLIQHLVNIAKENNCYKVTLATNEKNIGFYSKCGLIVKGTEMTRYFP